MVNTWFVNNVKDLVIAGSINFKHKNIKSTTSFCRVDYLLFSLLFYFYK